MNMVFTRTTLDVTCGSGKVKQLSAVFENHARVMLEEQSPSMQYSKATHFNVAFKKRTYSVWHVECVSLQ